MSLYHVLEGEPQGGRVYHPVILHVTVPLAQRISKAAEALAGFESLVPDIDPGELANIRAGEIVEWPVDGFHAQDAASTDGMLGRVAEDYDAIRAAALQDYKDKYRFYLEQGDTLPTP